MKLVRDRELGRIGVHGRDALKRAVRLSSSSIGAPIAESGHGELRDVANRFVGVVGRREHSARLGEHAEPFVRAALVVHIGAGAEPARDLARLIAQRERATEKPAIGVRRPRASGGTPPRTARPCEMRDPTSDRRRCCRMDGRRPPVIIVDARCRNADVFAPSCVEVLALSGRLRRPDELRHGFRERAEGALGAHAASRHR